MLKKYGDAITEFNSKGRQMVCLTNEELVYEIRAVDLTKCSHRQRDCICRGPSGVRSAPPHAENVTLNNFKILDSVAF